ncbi:PadR family transcriptional regulator [Actinotalea sp. C106]|uniref:PadR family transcriptional regulator n=1 Tax=Actinotalea sp. C106 TaxID=2908644 RepID=UPI00202948FC|nr:PadR family transcriptional regulator [Actinotalea sp. C106]
MAPTLNRTEQVRRELARGTVELAVLAALDEERRYGYELMAILRGAGEGASEFREGTLYPLLHRLEDAGYIAAQWETQGRAKPRKYYALTAVGREHLALLLAEWRALVVRMDALLGGSREVRT